MKIKKNKEFIVEETTHLDGTFEDITSNWEGRELEVHSDPIESDSAYGSRILLKFFNFKYPPGNHPIPTKKQILTKEYVDKVKTLLYFQHDLDLADEPRVVFQSDGFRVIFPCVERKGNRTFDRYGMPETTIIKK